MALALLVFLSGCEKRPPPPEEVSGGATYAPGENEPLISLRDDISAKGMQEVALYYRMRGENMLSREMSPLNVQNEKTLEETLIEALIDGPNPSLMELSGVFIPSTKLLRVGHEGDILIVSVSHHFLETPVDMPENWRENAAQRSEVLMRRKLALLSIVSTVTEQTDYASVLLLVSKDENDTTGRRIQSSEIFEEIKGDSLLAPVMRDEAYLLTHHNTAKVIMESIQDKDYGRLYRFVAGAPTEDTFLQQMYEGRNMFLSYNLSPGTVSSDGQVATLVAEVAYVDPSGVVSQQRFPLRLVYENSLWKIQYEALRRIVETK